MGFTHAGMSEIAEVAERAAVVARRGIFYGWYIVAAGAGTNFIVIGLVDVQLQRVHRAHPRRTRLERRRDLARRLVAQLRAGPARADHRHPHRSARAAPHGDHGHHLHDHRAGDVLPGSFAAVLLRVEPAAGVRAEPGLTAAVLRGADVLVPAQARPCDGPPQHGQRRGLPDDAGRRHPRHAGGVARDAAVRGRPGVLRRHPARDGAAQPPRALRLRRRRRRARARRGRGDARGEWHDGRPGSPHAGVLPAGRVHGAQWRLDHFLDRPPGTAPGERRVLARRRGDHRRHLRRRASSCSDRSSAGWATASGAWECTRSRSWRRAWAWSSSRT